MTGIHHSIIAALGKNIKPGLVLQAFALLILLVYFFVPASQPVFTWFGTLKAQYGYAYSFFATALFGGLIPFLYLWWNKAFVNRSLFGLLMFYVLFWGIKGMEVDLFYRFQADWFGHGGDWQTVLTKMAVDQFLYSALWAAPGITIIYLWMESGWNISRWREAMDREFFCVKIPTVILSNWLVWIPAVCVVYAMPAELQIPLFNLVLCFWVLLVAVLSRR
ncbi:MAG TPA: hypothetical protein VL995_18400 [Cellvibrio sp.]|nr:hypothetical protein [Cellvibrio sp.]